MNDTARLQVRSFNRSVTQRIGALQDEYLARGRPLGASRVLWEVGRDGTDLRALRARLDLDSGYLSRLVRGLERDGLVVVEPGSDDRRVRAIHLTDAGRAERAVLDERSDALAASFLAPLGEPQRARLLEAMADVEHVGRDRCAAPPRGAGHRRDAQRVGAVAQPGWHQRQRLGQRAHRRLRHARDHAVGRRVQTDHERDGLVVVEHERW